PAAEARSGHGQRSSSNSAAGAASTNHQPGGSARHCARSRSAAHTSAGQSQWYSIAARENNGPQNSGASSAASAPASTSGTNTNETTGIAIRLTTSPTSDTPPNTARVSGANASMTASCRRSARCRRDPGTSAVVSTVRMTPTAMKDSQNPADSGANASSSSTATSDSDQIRPAPTRRAHSFARAN